MPFFNAIVPKDYKKNERLDKYITCVFKDMNRSKLKSGLISLTVNGKNAKLSSKIFSGDEILLEWDETIPNDIVPENIPIDIIYEDKNVTVVNKHQGMVTHPAAGNWSGTLVNALLFHWGKSSVVRTDELSLSKQLAFFRPGIVHRLDKDTSGVLITARNRATEEYLGDCFKNHKSISKIYICICQGHPSSAQGFIRTNIARDIHNRKKFMAVPEGSSGKLAISKFKCIATYGPYSLMKIKIYTGRTHQIRVHLKYIGCPILGDPIYAKSTKGTLFEGATLMLHAYKLKLKLPQSNEFSIFKAKVPLRFKKVLKELHSKFNKIVPDKPKEIPTFYAKDKK